MSIIGKYNKDTKKHDDLVLEYKKSTEGKKVILAETSNYQATEEEKQVRQMIINHFRLSDLIMRTPRREFNDLSVLTRMTVDQMSFNTYQPNNGEAYDGDDIGGWKSRAMRPIVRNKAISIAAHVTANLIFPKVFAFNRHSQNEDGAAAQVMQDLMEWAGDQSDYVRTNLYAVIAALTNPASFIHTEYGDVYDYFKSEKNKKGKYDWEFRKNEELSGFQDTVVPCDELYVSDFYTHNIQRQDYLIWRRVQSYDYLMGKYGQFPNWKYVKPGVQVIYNDANTSFYDVYDPNLRQEMCEEIVYWNKAKDLKIIMINGVMLTDYDNPNPRQDKQYPFTKFGFELIDEGKCFYYKSLAFKLMQDANIVNTLYPMIIDGTYLALMPPMVNTGGQKISSNVIIPGTVTTLDNPDATMKPIQIGANALGISQSVLQTVEQSVSESSIPSQVHPIKQETAYTTSVREKEQQVLLGIFVQMIMFYVKDFGKLRLGDILQYLTIGETKEIEGKEGENLIYKAFFLYDRSENGSTKTKKIQFSSDLPIEAINKERELMLSYDVLDEQGGMDSNTVLNKVNPILFRSLKYNLQITPELVIPMTQEAERAFMLEEYDRAIANPILDQEQVTKEFLLGAYPKSKKDPERFIKKTNPEQDLQNMMLSQMQGTQGVNPANQFGQTGKIINQQTAPVGAKL